MFKISIADPVPEVKRKTLAGLLKKAQTGETAALQALCKALEGFIRGCFRQKFRDTALVDDLCQETYIRLLNNLPQIREEMKLTAFVAKVAFHVTQDYFREKYRRKEEALETDYQSEDRQESHLKIDVADNRVDEHILNKLDLETALQQLPEKSRTILILKSCGYNYEEIAEEVGISVSGVKMQVKRSLEQLRTLLFTVTILLLGATILFLM
jgi:RNA polymerase sigma-70 factor (ECF subfamily)